MDRDSLSLDCENSADSTTIHGSIYQMTTSPLQNQSSSRPPRLDQGNTFSLDFSTLPDFVSANESVSQNTVLSGSDGKPESLRDDVLLDIAPPPSHPIPGASKSPEEIRLFNLAMPEAKIYLTKSVILFIAVILTSSCFLAPIKGTAYFTILCSGPLFYCLVWMIIEFGWTLKVLGTLWFDSGECFKAFDIINVMLLILFVQIKVLNLWTSSLYASTFFFLAAHAYIYSCKGMMKRYMFNIFSRYYYFIRVLFFVLKFDGFIHWTWNYVFVPSWLFMSVKFCYFLCMVGTLTPQIMKRSSTELSATSVTGFIWHVTSEGMIFMILMTIYGFTEYQSLLMDFISIRILALSNIGINIILLFMSAFATRSILSFIVHLKIVKSHLVELENRQTLREDKIETCCEVEEKEQYFLRLSPTYFVPFQSSILLDDKDKISLSINDKENGQQMKSPLKNPIKTKDCDNLCYICCLSPSNVILKNCGHGGVCYNCVVSHIMLKNKCMECRKDVTGTFLIDPNHEALDIVKGTELHKIPVNITGFEESNFFN